MAPLVPAEIDLFTVPHSRMKELVSKYALKVQDVDYRNCQEVCSLLKELQMTLHEFKSHESIENMLIMDQLKNRLKQNHIYNSAVCDCHNDNRLQEMLNLVKNGKQLSKTSIGERLHYGHELQKAFLEFVQEFLPHMEEEENIFQPLLVEHFEYDELKVLKQLVIEQHELIKDPLYQEKSELDDIPEMDSTIKDFRDLDTNNLCVSSLYEDEFRICSQDLQEEHYEDELHNLNSQEDYGHNIFPNEMSNESQDITQCFELPTEILLKIFQFLDPPDRGRCAQVCSLWNNVVYSSVLWKEIYPVQWARGLWEFKDMNLSSTLQDEGTKSPRLKADEDADVDESEDYLDPVSQTENDFFISLLYHFLPRIGHGVEKIVFDGGQGVSPRLMHQTLLLCPNVTEISATYTFFDYYTLKRLSHQGGLKKLHKLDLEGCECMDDKALAELARCLLPKYRHPPSFSSRIKSVGPFVSASSSTRSNAMKSNPCHKNCRMKANFMENKGFQQLSVDTNQIDQLKSVTNNCCRGRFITNNELTDSPFSVIDNELEIEELGFYHHISNNFVQQPLQYANDREDSLSYGVQWSSRYQFEPTLESINLSGCWRCTNDGLLVLLNSGSLKNVRSLNLSSCFNLSGESLLTIAKNCLLLEPENLTYCCNILNGPYSSQASGCDSIGHPLKVCCRNNYIN